MSAIELHVCSGGNDANPGTSAKPFRTPERARDEIRRLKAKSPLHGGATVFFHQGDYPRDAAFELTTQDSGAVDAPIVYRSMPGQTVRFIGGRIIRDFVKVTDKSILDRLTPDARENVVQADLKALGVGELTPMQSRGFSRPITPAHIELFFNTEPMTLARWPNTGEFIKITDFPRGTGKNDGHGTMMGPLEGGFFYDSLRPRRWEESDDIWVHGYWAYDWANSYERIASIDKETGFIKTHPPHGLYGIHKGQRIFFLNVLEELDTPGEYFVDRARGILYFWPPSDIAKAEVAISLLDKPLISLNGVSHVTLRGVTLDATRAHGVTLAGGDHCTVAGCTIRNTGNYGVWIDGGTHHAVQSCDIHNNGDGGVNLLGGDRATLTPCHHVVDNCHFHHQARWSRCYFPAVHMQGVGTRVTHNHIHDHPHCAILFWGNEHHIELNYIHHTCHETGDVGAIYTGRDWTFQDNFIRHNYLHDIIGPGHLGAIAVYLDDCVSGITVTGNIIRKTQMAVMLGGGRDCVINNNLCIDADIGIHVDGRGMSQSQVWQNMVNNTMKQRLLEMKHHQPPYGTRFPQLATIDKYLEAGKGVPCENNIIARNVFVGGKHGLRPTWEATEASYAAENNVTLPDTSLFVDAQNPENAGYAFIDASPTLKAGFEPIPFDKIGNYKDEYRP